MDDLILAEMARRRSPEPVTALLVRISSSSRFAALGIIAMVLGAVSACTATRPVRNYDTVTIVDRNGVMTAADSQRAVDSLSVDAESRSDVLARLVADINSLSDVPIYKDNRVELLIDGPATYKSMFEAIRQAKYYIYLETYIFADDEAGLKFAALLGEKSTQGVVVKVMYDSLGSIKSDREFFTSMKRHGIDLIEYNNMDPIEGGNPLKINNRNHRKILIVDGRVAYTGGINLSSTYSSRSGGEPKRNPVQEGWRDTHIAVRGPAVDGFEQIFRSHWRARGGDDARLHKGAVDREPGNEIVAILTATGGDGEGSAIFAAYVDAMQLAEERVWITQAYFAPDKQFLGLLEQAADRGVDVRLLVPGVSDSDLVLNASRSKYRRLLESGVRIYESQHSLLHAKTAVIDGIWSTVGSSNLDYRSFLHNDEINAIILGAQFAHAMEQQFQKDIVQAREVTSVNWNSRPYWYRLREVFSWAVEYWL